MGYTRLTFLSAVLFVSVSACSSIESTHVIADQYGVDKGRTFAGVPISVTVADKTAFLVTESIYLVRRQLFDADGTPAGAPIESKETRTTIDRNPIPLGHSEIFTVDTKRPLSGTGKGSITLDKDKQYPTLISNDVNDNTLSTVLANLEEIKNTFTPQSGTPSSLATTEAVLSTRQYFLVYDPKLGTLTKMS